MPTGPKSERRPADVIGNPRVGRRRMSCYLSSIIASNRTRPTDDERPLVESSQSDRGCALLRRLVAIVYRRDRLSGAFACGVVIEAVA